MNCKSKTNLQFNQITSANTKLDQSLLTGYKTKLRYITCYKIRNINFAVKLYSLYFILKNNVILTVYIFINNWLWHQVMLEEKITDLLFYISFKRNSSSQR